MEFVIEKNDDCTETIAAVNPIMKRFLEGILNEMGQNLTSFPPTQADIPACIGLREAGNGRRRSHSNEKPIISVPLTNWKML